MRLLLTFGLVLLLTALGGCNKGDRTGDTARNAGRDPMTAAHPEAKPPAAPTESSSAEESLQIIARLAPEFNLTYDTATETIHGKGFPDQGVPASLIVDKVEKKLAGSAEITAAMREAELRTVFGQLVAAGEITANQQANGGQPAGTTAVDAAPEGDAATDDASPPQLNYHPRPEELMFPKVIYGDWRSVREDHANATVEHDDKYYELIQFRYQDNAYFHMYRDAQLVSNTNFPYTYDPPTGTVTLYGPDRQPIQTLYVTATDPDPYLLWVQREGSSTKTLYEKKGRGGEPVTLEDEIEGVRILKGDEAAEDYRRQKEKERQQSGG